MRRDITPTLLVIKDGQPTVQIHGAWLTDMLAEASLMQTIHLSLQELQGNSELEWDLSQLSALDHIGAQLLWQTWGKSYPAKLKVREQHQALFERLAEVQKIDRKSVV